MLLQALRVEIEMKNLNLQVTFLVQKGVGARSDTKKEVWERRSHAFPPNYTPGHTHAKRTIIRKKFSRKIKYICIEENRKYL